jgi:16S rRNA (uracil1498-N3)-methyltransferase
LEYLSNIELYYTSAENINSGIIVISGDEFEHAVKVMRNKVSDVLHVTNGIGKIFRCKINEIKKDKLTAEITEEFSYNNDASNISFCIPKLKNPERLKFSIEKCVELGITNFLIFNSMYTVSKSLNIQRLEKIALSAMKQSLRSFLPEITSTEFKEITTKSGVKILFDQSATSEWNNEFFNKDEQTFFIFGPEGGFNKFELDSVKQENHFRLSGNRLRTASLLNLL